MPDGEPRLPNAVRCSKGGRGADARAVENRERIEELKKVKIMAKLFYYLWVAITIVMSIAMVMSAGRDGMLWILYAVIFFAMVKACKVLRKEASDEE